MFIPFGVSRSGRPRALSLVEVLVAGALGLIVLTLLVRTLIPTMAASRKAADRVDLHQRAALLGERVATDLRSSARVGIGLYPSNSGLRVSIHPRQKESGTVAWEPFLRLYDWQDGRVTGTRATLTVAPTGPVIPPLLSLDGLAQVITARVENVESFALTLNPGPSARLDLRLARGVESMEFRRLVFLRNGTD